MGVDATARESGDASASQALRESSAVTENQHDRLLKIIERLERWRTTSNEDAEDIISVVGAVEGELRDMTMRDGDTWKRENFPS